VEAYRLASLATKTLQERGVAQPRDTLYGQVTFPGSHNAGKPTRLTEEDIAALTRLWRRWSSIL